MIPSGFEDVFGSSVVVVFGLGEGVVLTGVVVFVSGVFVFVVFPLPKTLDVSELIAVVLLTTGTSGVCVVVAFVLVFLVGDGEGAGACKDTAVLSVTGVAG